MERLQGVVRFGRFGEDHGERARSRQALVVERFGLSGDVQYDWSTDEAQITWSCDGKVFLTGRLTVIGSISVTQQTWLWSWANESLQHAALGDIEQVRQFGEENDYPVLPWPGFNSHPELVAEARMVAASVLDAEGAVGGVNGRRATPLHGP
ncbi:DUF6882 domain-containing protein [Streptomyces sp. NPDC001523]|uniref:DUF6882 domain-containing protein n=1 Tax=Streptomyces sp. NPDC001523 TaxID=3154383 RepID=UPI00333496E2